MNRYRKYCLTFLSVFLCLHLCVGQNSDTLKYIFLGHIYEYGSNGIKVDDRVEQMDLSIYDRIWLGGDVCSEAGLKYSTLKYIDDLFDLSKPETHWALGNHDIRNGNLEWIEELTGRPTFYIFQKDDITTMVLDGNISPLDCEKLNKQYDMISNVCDSITSSRLIIMVHHGIYTDVPNVDNPNQYGHSQLKNWVSNCYSDSTTYIESIYPKLVEAQNRGVQVIQIMGDVGANAKSYEATSSDGIVYLGSGLNDSKDEYNNIPIIDSDLVLIFTHVLSTNTLTWEFVELNGL